MTLHQRFRLGDVIECLAVCQDKDGPPYSRLDDVQETFPSAIRFKLGKITINFLTDDNGNKYEPKRIAYHPDHIIDVVCAAPVSATSVDASLGNVDGSSAEVESSSSMNQLLSSDHIDLLVSKLSLQPLTSAHQNAPAQSSIYHPSSRYLPRQTVSLARSMTAHSFIDSSIANLRLQIGRSTDRQSIHHRQLLEQLIQMVAHQKEMLREQAASKEREKKMLTELEAAKERDQELLRMQQQIIDRLIVAQQRVDAILVQNYELHEYPIPRLFVILPDSYESWDPRNILTKRLRLFFLCECGEDCGQGTSQDTTSGQPAMTTASPPIAPIRVRNRIHLAKHEGYELSRPTEFYDRYGPYVLGMLKILKHCLAVAAVVAPAVALAENCAKDVMNGVKSISESTMQAVDMSIDFLEQQLGDGGASDGRPGNGTDGEDADGMFENLAALEGADLRRLDTFLRSNDQDKILGDLYRTTTEEGHVKWVCFEHYQEKYRVTALALFVQSVEAAGGSYDPHFRRATISLTSSTIAKDFLKRLTRQAHEVDNLDVTLAWDFGSADLVNLVNMVAKSNIKSLTLDLQDDHTSNPAFAAFRLGKGRYHSLLSLFSNKNIRRLQLSNLQQLGTRTSNLPSSVVAPWMQSFHFHGQVNDEGRDRLTNILSRCPNLVDLRLTGSLYEGNVMDLSLHLQIFALKKLQRLHVTGWYRDWPETPEGYIWRDGMSLREFVCTMGALDHNFVEESIRRSHEILEVLVLFDFYFDYTPIDLTPKTSGESSYGSYFPRLTHLDLQAGLTSGSREFLLTVLPRLNLVHFGCRADAGSLLRHINLASVKSLSIDEMLSNNFKALREAIKGLGGECQIESLNVDGVDYFYEDLSEILKMLRLKRLSLSRVSASAMVYLFRRLNLPSLQIISLYGSEYLPEAGNILAQRRKDESVDAWAWKGYAAEGGRGAVTDRASPIPLFEHRVQNEGGEWSHHFQFLQPILPEYSY